MKILISIFTALLLIVLGNYANAEDAKDAKDTKDTKLTITKPKATNGADDVEAEVKPDKDSIKVSVADFKDFSEKTLDDRVVEFRRGNVYYTMIPLRDLWFTPQRKEAFEVAQVFGDKLMKVWLKKTLNMRYGGGEEAIQSEINKLSSDEIRALLVKGAQNSNMPSAREIIEASQDAKDAVKKLKDRSKFFVEFDELISAFDKSQEEIFGLRGLSSLKSKATPTALSFVASFKAPASFIAALEKTRYLSGVGVLLNSSINFTVTARPWKIIKRNLDTGAISESWYIESATQAWLLKDFNKQKLALNGPLRLGVGVLWGDYDRMADITGFVTGYSKSFNFKKTSLSGTLPIPSNVNIKVGTITAVAETLTQGLDIGNFVKHGYFMMTKQYGFQAPMGSSSNWNVGGIFNLASITDRVSLNQDTLDELLKTVAEEIPGAQVTVKDDQIEILVPDKETKPETKKETSPKPFDPAPLKGQDNVLPSR